MLEEHLLIAIIAALLNILLSILVPPLLNKSDLPFSVEIKKHYECNKQFILISTILTVILVYISLKISPYIHSQLFGNISELSKVSELPVNKFPEQTFVPSQQQPFQVAHPVVNI
jgi:hypothetical protein